ncbi:DUF3397 domain-containing protein [Enterococcus sp. HY326]|uniref:DUF3397 domain-containing protein n=1 Tax=Enterococcus sp. HY326 TaxID=2971265 RepID=UPI0022406251|nr:DUF3397 domain-containing protein [Enterococcus sp. HY326]
MESFSPMIMFWLIFPVIALFASNFLTASVRFIKKMGLKTPDLAIPFLFVGLHEISRTVYGHSILPYFMIAVLILGIGVALFHAHYYREIMYGRFFKMFWRLVFLLTMVLYITLIVLTIIRYI